MLTFTETFIIAALAVLPTDCPMNSVRNGNLTVRRGIARTVIFFGSLAKPRHNGRRNWLVNLT